MVPGYRASIPPPINCIATKKITTKPTIPTQLCFLIYSAKNVAAVAIKNTDNSNPNTNNTVSSLAAAATPKTLSKLNVTSAIITA